jgi:NAD(P)-dependent dehydrogenase (short-subunit alcohol dehydrogenase family)
MGRLDGRVAIVTGAARGIGKAIAARYAAEGASVVGVDVLEERGREAFAELAKAAEPAGGQVDFMVGDVTDEARVAEIVAQVEHDFGRIDILVNNAAIQVEGRLHEQTVEAFHKVVNVNLLGTFLFSRAVIPAMRRQHSGVIVNLSSVLGLVGDAVLPVYSATKAGILGLTRSVAVAYAREGIRCVAICPGDIDTELNDQYFNSQPDPVAFRAKVEGEYPVKRIGTVDEVAAVAAFLASGDASFVNGTHVLVDGGVLSRVYELDTP